MAGSLPPELRDDYAERSRTASAVAVAAASREATRERREIERAELRQQGWPVE